MEDDAEFSRPAEGPASADARSEATPCALPPVLRGMTHNPLHGGLQPSILILAVMRFSDKRIIASLVKSKDVTIEGLRECVAGNASIQAGKRYSSQGSSQTINYILDAQGRVYAMVTMQGYSPRVAFGALDEMQQLFNKELGVKAASATENGLSKQAQPIFSHITEKFNNPSNMDKISSVQEKVDIVKSTMKENIQQLLLNEEKLERIETAATQLNEQSQAFKTNAKQLSDKMWWKMWKMRLVVGGLIVAVLIVLIVPIAVTANKKK